MSNQFIFIGLFLTGMHITINYVFQAIPDIFVTLLSFLLLFFSLLLNLGQKPFHSRLLIVFGGTILINTLQILFGPKLRLQSMSILFLVTATLFFDFGLMIKSVIFITFSFLAASAVCNFITPPFEELISPNGRYIRFLFSVTMIATLIGKLILENKEYHFIMKDQLAELTEKNQQLKSFNYIVSHDLKEPVRSIVSFSQLIKRDINNGKPINNEYVGQLIRSGKQLDELLNDVVDFMESKDKMLSDEVFKIDELVDELKISMSDALKEKNVKIQCQEFPLIKSSKIAVSIILRDIDKINVQILVGLFLLLARQKT